MTDDTLQRKDIQGPKLILYILGLVNLVYLLLLYSLESFTVNEFSGSLNEAGGLTIIPPLLAVMTVFDIILVYKVFLPKVRNAEDLEKAFPYMLICSVLIEAIGIYGLLIGLLDLFAIQIPIRWEVVLPFILLSLFIQLYLVQNTFSQKFEDLISTSYETSSEQQY